MDLKFTWRSEKAKRNLAKHKISFETATEVFSDPYLIIVEDCEGEHGEMRYQAIGRATSEVLLMVVYVDRSSDGSPSHYFRTKGRAYEESAYTDQF